MLMSDILKPACVVGELDPAKGMAGLVIHSCWPNQICSN